MSRLLACTETITLVRHVQTHGADSYTKEYITGASWFEKTGDALSSNGETPSAQIIVRIPADVCPEDLPAEGDFVVKGRLPPRFEFNPKNLAVVNCFRIATVGNNLRCFLPHVVVKSE